MAQNKSAVALGSADPHYSSGMQPCGGKPNPNDMQLNGAVPGAQNSWTSDALVVVEEIAVALQLGRDDIEPLSDAPSYEVLCTRSHQVCMQAIASGCEPSSLSPQHLSCLQQLSASTMQLASALFCEPEVALQLLAAGSYTAATDQLKATVKELNSHLIKCLETAQAAQPAQAVSQLPGSQQQQQRGLQSATGPSSLLQGLLPAVHASAQQLLHMSLNLAAFIAGAAAPGGSSSSGSGSSTQIPKEMRSMAVLNLSWANLTRLLLAVPADARLQVLQAQDILQGLTCALQQLQRAVRDLPQQAPERREVVVRFWLQSVSRLTSVVWEQAAQLALGPLMEATLEVYEYACFPREEYQPVQDFLQQVLQPRLVACLAALLSSSPDDEAATQAKLDCLLNFSGSRSAGSNPAAGGDRSEPGLQEQRHLQLQVHLLVVLDFMQHLPNVAFEVIQLGCRQLLAWAVETAGRGLCSFVLAHEAGSALLQHVLQSCLACVVGCAPALQQQRQQELMGSVMQLALSQQPLVAFVAQQLLADVLSCSSGDALQHQLSGLLQLLEAAACCCAVPGAGVGCSHGAEALINTLVAALQACDEATAANWVSQHLLTPSILNDSNGSNAGSSSSSGGGSSWLDAGSCSLLACHCGLLLRLGPSVASDAFSIPKLEELLNQLWLTAQQVWELLGPQQQQQQVQQLAQPPGQAACDRVLVLHQLTWLLEGMQAVLQLVSQMQAAAVGQGSPPAPSSLTQGCSAFALDLLKAISSSSSAGSLPSSSTPPAAAAAAGGAVQGTTQAVHTACTAAALKVLAAAGQVAVHEGADELLQMLQGIAQKDEALHALLAAVCGNIGVPAGNAKHEELFQLLLSSPRWAVRHAAFEGLLQRLRHNNYSGSGIVRLLPPGMRSSSSEATPAVIEVVKAHLHRQPDTQAQQAFQDSYRQLIEQHSQVLAGAFNSSSCGGNSSSVPGSSSSLSCSTVAAELAQLEELLAACCAQLGGARSAGGTAALQGAGGHGAAAAAAAAGPAHTLLQLASAAAGSLQAVDKALALAEADVRLLMSVAQSAAQSSQLGPDDIMLVSRQGTNLVGACASMCSRLRCLQDSLACLKG